MNSIFRLFKYVKRKTWFAIALVIFAAIMDSAFTLATPMIAREIINQVFEDSDFSAFKIWLPIYVSIGFLAAIFRFTQRYVNEYVSQNIIYDIRNQLFSKIQRQSIDFFDRMETGQLIARGTSDMEAIRRLLSIGLRIFLRAIFLYVGIFVLIGLMNVTLMLIVLGIAPILFIVMFSYARKARPLMRQIQNKFGDMNNILAENVYGSRVVRAFAAEKFEEKKFENENQIYLDLNIRMARLRAFLTTTFPLILGAGSFFILFFGGKAYIAGTLIGGIGTLIAVNGYLVLLQMPTRFLSFAILHFQNGTASLNRIFEVIDMEKKVPEKEFAEDMPTIKGNINFKNITFAYTEDNPPVLRDVNLKIKPGETVAFLGTTGSGKSTIVSLVPRFYDPQEGDVFIDNVNLKDVKIESLRKQIALVQQETFLFAKTIRENIAFGKPDATDEEIIRVAKIAQAHEFISETPNGYETEVGERGVKLSGGQKQRLTIARALLLNSPILIMDDSSSALDFETENHFQHAVGELIKGRTTLIVTQRLSTIKFATLIVVMDQGQIVEKGTHDELIAKRGLYKHLYETQLIEQEFDISADVLTTIEDQEIETHDLSGGKK
ncbi:MAG: ABC transporter ATP-binding protein [Candidatus Heimdallarchaeota archaeon]